MSFDTNIPLKMAKHHKDTKRKGKGGMKKGSSGSFKPLNPDISFVTLKAKEIEKIVLDLAKEDTPKSKIGLILRDTYAVPDVKLVCKKSISKILEENNVVKKLPEDLNDLYQKYLKVVKHLDKNTRDKHNRRGLNMIEAKIIKLTKYYKSKNVLDMKWRHK